MARRSHDVTHVYFKGDLGPKGDFRRRPSDGEKLFFSPVSIGLKYDKGNLIRRRYGDLAYGANVARLIAEKQPDVVLSGNTPTESQGYIVRACRESASAFVYWVQDFYSLAATIILNKKLGLPGRMIGMYYRMLERRQMHEASGIVTVSTTFEPLASQWGRDAAKVTTIENWGLAEDICPVEKANPWAMAAGLASSFNFLYSGTLALKHNPDLLLHLARAMRFPQFFLQKLGFSIADRSIGLDAFIPWGVLLWLYSSGIAVLAPGRLILFAALFLVLVLSVLVSVQRGTT